MSTTVEVDLAITMFSLLNPFALFLYLHGVAETLTFREFFAVTFKATMYSIVVLLSFALVGEALFGKALGISFESFRIFGGVLLFAIALLFILKGEKSMISLRGNLGDLATEISMPYMVGPGSISLAILMGHKQNTFWLTISVSGVLLMVLLVLLLLVWLYQLLGRAINRERFENIMGMMLRINAFLIGAFGVDMVLVGLKKYWLV